MLTFGFNSHILIKSLWRISELKSWMGGQVRRKLACVLTGKNL